MARTDGTGNCFDDGVSVEFLITAYRWTNGKLFTKSAMDLTSLHSRISSVARSTTESLTFLGGTPE